MGGSFHRVWALLTQTQVSGQQDLAGVPGDRPLTARPSYWSGVSFVPISAIVVAAARLSWLIASP